MYIEILLCADAIGVLPGQPADHARHVGFQLPWTSLPELPEHMVTLITSHHEISGSCLFLQAKDQAELNELLIWASARGLLADVRGLHRQHTLHLLPKSSLTFPAIILAGNRVDCKRS